MGLLLKKMKQILTLILISLYLMLFSSGVLFAREDKEAFVNRINKIPDFLQINKELPLNGSQYCGPVSASNSIVWMINQGYITSNKTYNQLELVKLLGNYMSVSRIGTNPEQFCKGIDHFLKDQQIKYRLLEYQGWRPCKKFKSKNNVDLEKLKTIFKSKTAVWLNVGWYRLQTNSQKKLFKRYGGHWVTLVGYGFDGNKINPDYLIVHDPSPDAGKQFRNEYLLLEKINSGILDSGNNFKYSGLPIKASTFYRVLKGLNHNINTNEVVIIDGAVVLEIN